MLDQCNLCEEEIIEEKSGILIAGENLIFTWAGGNKTNEEDPFLKSGNRAPLNGVVSLCVCKSCLKLYLNI